MKTTYLIWKDPSCAGANPEWQELTGQEFYALVKSPDTKGRNFIKLPSTHADGSDGAIIVEVTRADYKQWKREKNHIDYLNREAQPFTTISYHAVESDDGESYGEELLIDDVDIEADYIKSLEPEQLTAAIQQLNLAEYELIDFLILSGNDVVDQDYADKTGISRRTVTYRKLAVLKKIKNLLNG